MAPLRELPVNVNGTLNATALLRTQFTATHTTLAALYLIPVMMCVIWRVMPMVRHRRGTFWQLSVSGLLLLGCFARMSFWIMQPLVFSEVIDLPTDVNFYWNMIPSYLFFSCYLVILFLWVEIYHKNAAAVPRFVNFHAIYGGVLAAMYCSLLALIVADLASPSNSPKYSPVPMAETLYRELMVYSVASLYLMVTAGFVVYGLLFYCRYQGQGRQPLLQKMREAVLPRLRNLTIFVTIIFTARASLTLSTHLMHVPQSTFTWLDLAYFGPLEVFPLVLMMLIFRTKNQPTNPPAAESLSETTNYISGYSSSSYSSSSYRSLNLSHSGRYSSV
eukprot:TRINITY_DN10533_c0_g1_i1.p1 TRINITY_DN10533_c0_g1~~TRINITY_DN10533_c0_g1_i1.p1  ORF type:complete len:332 (+),score=39.24 TRINITY_DN10533_c0_g1_i1:152-1147(+)